MNKHRFLNIVQNHVLVDDDVISLGKMADEYPYSQIIHTLVAKHHHEVRSSDAKASIQKAAIYATDRAVLKRIIESTSKQVAKESGSPTDVPSLSLAPSGVQKKSENPNIERSGVSDIDQLRKDLYLHLEELQKSKKPFESDLSTPSKKKTSKTNTAKPKTKTKASLKKKSEVEKKPVRKVKKNARKSSSALSQKEQVDLIEKFIQSPPKITKGKIRSSPDEGQEDLSVKSVKIEEEFASENLAKILIKQGNKEKAIDIYKKLIWKFPQKKAYFATQIEGLKK